MGINTGLDLSNDFSYMQSVFTKCTDKYKDFEESMKETNKTLSDRMDFICFQFKNVFNEGQWV